MSNSKHRKVNYNRNHRRMGNISVTGRIWIASFVMLIVLVIWVIIAVTSNSGPKIINHAVSMVPSNLAYPAADGRMTTDAESIYLGCVVSSQAKGDALTNNLDAQGIKIVSPTSSNGHDQVDGFDVQVPDRSKINDVLKVITKIVNQTKPCD